MADIYEKIVPETELEFCSKCLKYLNVKPIKTYHNGEVWCGRCTKTGDEGVLSSHNDIDDDRLFKCFNKLNGCHMLLTTSQVAQHELTCITILTRCPYCQPDSLVAPFYLEKHFEELHNLCLLKSNEIFIFEDNIKKTFLYKHNDRLFYIVVEFRMNENILKAFHLEIPNKTNGVKVNFAATSYNLGIDSNRVLTSYESLSRQKNNMQNPICIQITINAEVTMLSYLPLPNVENENVEGNINPDLNILQKLAEKQILERFKFFSKVCLISRIIWPPTVEKSNLPEDYIVGKDLTHVIKVNLNRNTKIYLHCYNCFNSLYGGIFSGGFVRLNNNLFFLCDICYNLEKNRENIINLGGFNKLEPLIYIKYNCMWNCGSQVKYLPFHSYLCHNQTGFQCPIKSCKEIAPLDELFTHLNNVHNIQSEDTFIWNMCLNSDLLCNKTVIERYIWVMPYFVKVKFIAIDNFWKVKIEILSNIKVPEDLRVKALLFCETGELLDIATEDCGVHLKPTDSLGVHCILERNDDNELLKHFNNE